MTNRDILLFGEQWPNWIHCFTEGKIVIYEVNAGNVGRNAAELLRRLHACQFVYEHGDNVCPAKWKLGEKTIQTTIENIGK